MPSSLLAWQLKGEVRCVETWLFCCNKTTDGHVERMLLHVEAEDFGFFYTVDRFHNVRQEKRLFNHFFLGKKILRLELIEFFFDYLELPT